MPKVFPSSDEDSGWNCSLLCGVTRVWVKWSCKEQLKHSRALRSCHCCRSQGRAGPFLFLNVLLELMSLKLCSSSRENPWQSRIWTQNFTYQLTYFSTYSPAVKRLSAEFWGQWPEVPLANTHGWFVPMRDSWRMTEKRSKLGWEIPTAF